MKVILISDTHGYHRDVVVPEGDLLVHAGDWSMTGEDEIIKDFADWLGEQPHKHKIVIAGNHDRSVEFFPETYIPRIREHATYLDCSGCEFDKKTFWGSPWTPFFHSDYWRFHTTTKEQRKKMWANIPDNLDLLITHGPPNRVLDKTLEGDYAGDIELLLEIAVKVPRFHVFGHIHEGYGQRKEGSTTFINASLLNSQYALVNKPIEIIL